MSYDLNSQFDQTFGLPSYGNLAGGGVPISISNIIDSGISNPAASMAALGLPPLPDISGGKGGFLNGFGTDDAKLVLGGLQTIGNLWGAFQSMKLAKEQFKYTKNVTDTNLNNQIKSYNTALSDRANSRAVMQSQSPEQAQAYVDQNKLVRSGG